MNDKWQPIESAPTDGSRILVYGKEDGMQVAMCSQVSGWWINSLEGDHGFYCISPTHWQPLPKGPINEN